VEMWLDMIALPTVILSASEGPVTATRSTAN